MATNAERGASIVKILSYNIWFREDLEVHKRMKAVGNLIQQHSPDIICFQVKFIFFSAEGPWDSIKNWFIDNLHFIMQEVTPNIYDILRQSGWWEEYCCSFSNEKAFPGPYFCMQVRSWSLTVLESGRVKTRGGSIVCKDIQNVVLLL